MNFDEIQDEFECLIKLDRTDQCFAVKVNWEEEDLLMTVTIYGIIYATCFIKNLTSCILIIFLCKNYFHSIFLVFLLSRKD